MTRCRLSPLAPVDGLHMPWCATRQQIGNPIITHQIVFSATPFDVHLVEHVVRVVNDLTTMREILSLGAYVKPIHTLRVETIE